MSRTILLAVVGALIAGAALAVGGLFALGVLTFGAAKEETTTASSAKTPAAQTTETPKTTQTTPTPSKSIPAMTGVAAVGETTDMGDRTFTVNDIQRGYVFPYNIPKPDAGNEFALANITITNKSAQPITINMLHFKSEDSNGVRRNAHAASQAPNPIPNVGSVAPNGELTGNLAIEVPQGESTVKLVYQPQR